MMSDSRGGPCYLYTDIWLIDWLQIINNSQHFSSAEDPLIHISGVTGHNHCHVTFSNIYVFPMPLLTLAQAAGFFQPIRGQNGESLTNQRRGLLMS